MLKGLKYILTNCARSHLYLKKILPKLSDSLHDLKDVVRQAMVDLLCAVSNVKMIKYWDVCSLEHILARLEVEKSAIICGKIVNLLFNSFFPTEEDEDTKIRRCLYLIKQNQAASRGTPPPESPNPRNPFFEAKKKRALLSLDTN